MRCDVPPYARWLDRAQTKEALDIASALLERHREGYSLQNGLEAAGHVGNVG